MGFNTIAKWRRKQYESSFRKAEVLLFPSTTISTTTTTAVASACLLGIFATSGAPPTPTPHSHGNKKEMHYTDKSRESEKGQRWKQRNDKGA
ncbi:hypothetical protein SK128_021494 [Halocaridina rubra]|uniref:Uncharacterized protein n=1 Tax=Halocaridina rubra TaxID=373956 RepID=A0AAN8WMU2_HALRR